VYSSAVGPAFSSVFLLVGLVYFQHWLAKVNH
jgi:hypothetical protein